MTGPIEIGMKEPEPALVVADRVRALLRPRSAAVIEASRHVDHGGRRVGAGEGS